MIGLNRQLGVQIIWRTVYVHCSLCGIWKSELSQTDK